MPVSPAAEAVFNELRSQLRPASVAEVGGFRPPDDQLNSWFGRGAALPGEGLPVWNGEPMLPLLQIRVSDLPVRPSSLDSTQYLVLFHNTKEHPFDKPNGEGWQIREYTDASQLQPLDQDAAPLGVKPFPIRWNKIDDDGPGWETAWDLVDLSPVNDDKEAGDAFFDIFTTNAGTKVGGFPCEIQHGYGLLDDYVFQVGSEEKANWMWADNGIGYFYKKSDGSWSWSCQFY